MDPGMRGDAGTPDERDLDSATQNAINQLSTREIDVPDDADPAVIVELLNAVEEFETAVARRGGDSFTNAPDSENPDDPRFVLPRQRGDESLGDYAERIRNAVPR